jgi:hypothetical protein
VYLIADDAHFTKFGEVYLMSVGSELYDPTNLDEYRVPNNS